MRILLDTNRYVDLVNSVQEAERFIKSAREVWISLIVLGELRFGFANGNRRRANEARLKRFLAKPGVHVLELDEETTEIYGDLCSDLRKRGIMIPGNDRWIASQAMQHHLTLYSRDKHFRGIVGLKHIE